MLATPLALGRRGPLRGRLGRNRDAARAVALAPALADDRPTVVAGPAKMPIPDYQTLMLPLLRIAADGKEHRIGDVVGPLARQFTLSEAEQVEMLPSGRQAILNNRVHWGRLTYRKPNCLKSPAGVTSVSRSAAARS
jgi:Mrr N-terminal domain